MQFFRCLSPTHPSTPIFQKQEGSSWVLAPWGNGCFQMICLYGRCALYLFHHPAHEWLLSVEHECLWMYARFMLVRRQSKHGFFIAFCLFGFHVDASRIVHAKDEQDPNLKPLQRLSAGPDLEKTRLNSLFWCSSEGRSPDPTWQKQQEGQRQQDWHTTLWSTLRGRYYGLKQTPGMGARRYKTMMARV